VLVLLFNVEYLDLKGEIYYNLGLKNADIYSQSCIRA